MKDKVAIFGIKPGRLDTLVQYIELVDRCYELEELMYDREINIGQDFVYWGMSDELQQVVQQRLSMHDKHDISWIELEALHQAGF